MVKSTQELEAELANYLKDSSPWINHKKVERAIEIRAIITDRKETHYDEMVELLRDLRKRGFEGIEHYHYASKIYETLSKVDELLAKLEG